MDSFYNATELKEIGFKSYGIDVKISRFARIYNPELIEIGNHVRIDDFCFLSGKIHIENYVHIATASLLYGGPNGIFISDFVGVSQRCTLIADSDDYSGKSLTNPTTSSQYKTPNQEPIILEKHAIVGTSCVILPGVILSEGSAIGAMSLVVKNTEPWTISIGSPAKVVKKRDKKLLELEKQFLIDKEMEKVNYQESK